MKYKVKVNLPNRPRGEDVEVLGVGVVPNGSSGEFEFEPEVAEAMRKTPGLTVTSVSAKKAKKAAKAKSEASTSDVQEDAADTSDEGGEA